MKKVFLAVMLFSLIAAPFALKPYGIYLLSLWVVMTIAAIGLNLTLGYAGQISLAQGSFVGIGAYAAALLTTAGWPLWSAFLLAIALSLVIGWVLGYPALRVQHHYLAFVTLAFATLVFLVLRNEEWLTKGVYGITGIPRPTLFGWSTKGPIAFYFFCLGILALVSAGTWWLVRSPWGRAFTALRENPIRADSLGVDTRRYTLMAFAFGSAIGGIAGRAVRAADPVHRADRVQPQPVAQPAADGDGRRLGLLPRPVPRRRGLGAAARMDALRQRGALPDLLRRGGDGADGVLPSGLLGLAERARRLIK